MYENFYGLTTKPFQLNPDPAFYYGSSQHKRAMSYLEYGLHQNEGFIVVTGEIGAGKTTLVRNLFSQLDPNQVVASHIVSTQLEADDTLRLVAAGFGIATKGLEKSQLLLSLEAFLVSVAQEGKRCLLVVDEAQNLAPQAVEELRMLSNFQLETHALLQSFLVGQPEFRKILQSPHMEQLRQRVIATCHVSAMSPAETRGYIEHRLTFAGHSGPPLFDDGAFNAIFAASAGLPRRINSLCDRLLWYGYLGELRRFDQLTVNEVADEMRDESGLAKVPGFAVNCLPDTTLEEEQSMSAAHLSNSQRVDGGARVAYELSNFSRKLARIEDLLLRMETSNQQAIEILQRAVSADVARRSVDHEDR